MVSLHYNLGFENIRFYLKNFTNIVFKWFENIFSDKVTHKKTASVMRRILNQRKIKNSSTLK
jgi:hypothetical protein